LSFSSREINLAQPVNSHADHPLFRRYAIASTRRLSNGAVVPVPYHIYRGDILLIGGTADYAKVGGLLKPEQVQPVRTRENRALMGIWVCDFHEASLGQHQELQFSFFVSRRHIADLEPHPLLILETLAFNDDMRTLCHGLCNDSEDVVCYNREVLGLNAQMTAGQITTQGEMTTLAFTDPGGHAIFRGHIQRVRRQPMTDLTLMLRYFGLRKLMRLAELPWLSMQVMNPVSTAFPDDGEAQAYTQSDQQITRRFNPQTDQLTFGDLTYAQLGFEPQFVMQMSGCKFVYLNIHNLGDR
jgi:hypothetical protein